MAVLAAWQFATAAGAESTLPALRELPAAEIARVHGAAVISWPVGSWPAGGQPPRIRQLPDAAGPAPIGEAFWTVLFGILFLMPLLGPVIGPAGGGLGGQLALAGIDDTFVRDIHEVVRPGTSALFMMSTDAVLDRLRAGFPGSGAALISTNLSPDQEENLRHAFAVEEPLSA